jgi:hypothetical protein
MKANLKIGFSEVENQKSENIEIEINIFYKKNEFYDFVDALVKNDKFENGFKKILEDRIREYEEDYNVEFGYEENINDEKIKKGLSGLMNNIMKNKNNQQDEIDELPF